ncbi:MAG: hypothetical protein RQ741_10285 [Wenzhouxiangellaceae bacterium]|nr:hypothetical protein [Wenzhouxiangellaceae bacterium]
MTQLMLVCHQGVGEALVAAAEVIVDHPLAVTVVPVRYIDDPDRSGRCVARQLKRLGLTGPVLVLTDLPGATPHNTALQAASNADPPAPVVTGLNLPMLLRALNHLDVAPLELADMVEQGACRAIISGSRHEA